MTAEKLRLHHRLGFQLGVAVAVVVAISFALVSGFVAHRERETLTREFTLRLLAETRSLAVATSAPLLRRDPELDLHPLVLKALAETPDLLDLVVLDSQGRIQGNRDLLRVGSLYERGTPGAPIELPREHEGESAHVDGDVIVIEQAIRHLGQPIGLLVARVSRESIENAVRASRRHLAILGAMATALAVFIVLGMVSAGLRPLDELRRGVLQLASGDLGVRVQIRSHNELSLFGTLLNQMADGLERAQNELVHKERLDREIEIAHELQSMLLPKQAHGIPGYDVESRYVSALEVSGDYYDVIPLGAERVCLVTADVSGKGVPGLVVMSMLRTALHGRAHPGMQLDDVLVAANRMLRGVMKRGMFVTCHIGILDLTTGIYRYASAGHCAPVLFGRGVAGILPAGGKPLGCFPDSVIAKSLVERSVRLENGDGLFLYTDGLVESMNPNDRTLGIQPVLERLRRSVDRAEDAAAESPGRGAAQIVEDILAQVDTHRGERQPSDDLTLIVVRRQSNRVMASTGGRA